MTGRGGAAFPAYRKCVAVADAARRTGRAPVVVANGAESEPTSHKHRTLRLVAPPRAGRAPVGRPVRPLPQRPVPDRRRLPHPGHPEPPGLHPCRHRPPGGPGGRAAAPAATPTERAAWSAAR
ncbi:hypothetical protein [Streptomyces sp. NPDC093060]|uniref:hypothetical protein n=1 Tax=Streptomyces sp. NPDC093060 TaxID=3366019 RepID=UPI0038268171